MRISAGHHGKHRGKELFTEFIKADPETYPQKQNFFVEQTIMIRMMIGLPKQPCK